MNYRKFIAVFTALTMTAAVFSGCGVKPQETDADQDWVTVEDNTEKKETEAAENIKKGSTEGTEKGKDDSKNTGASPVDTSLFSDVSNYEFWFSSGAGGWCTSLTLQPDGTFNGQYYDSEMGDTGEDYPNGSQYQCNFYGKFTEPVQVNAYTYRFRIETIQYSRKPGEEEIINGVRYIYSQPYGLDGTGDIYLYLPEAPVDELPKEYLDWVQMAMEDTGKDTLGFFGLYNVEEQDGFSSYELSKEAVALNKELAALEEKAQEMNDRLQSGELSQIEMNRLSGELYKLWDDELNSLWGRIKKKLGSEEMQKLTEEERAWIKWKEQAVKDAGSEMEGGSMQPLLENDKAAEVTRERVYELAGWLK
ncbi:MAG: DUF1311 domain-containing protein [Agathobacter sp.]|nr:DUF1311 domain-containing protein [Agathobacter sp.]